MKTKVYGEMLSFNGNITLNHCASNKGLKQVTKTMFAANTTSNVIYMGDLHNNLSLCKDH